MIINFQIGCLFSNLLLLLAGGQGGGEGAKYGDDHKEGENKERLLAGKKLQPTDGEIAKLEHLVERTHALTAPS